MPYINKEDRKEFLKKLKLPAFYTPGELNFILTKVIAWYLKLKPRHIHYSDYNEVMGVLECMKQEIYRRTIAPYEDSKKEEHGDVFND